ncbi:hypothetical protein ULMS_05990 [Patiriisocius marinistellae]|uniref:Uncharacterized protein n=1 Tax=Patiriisocius marinistellae TaxID=2494560 RepID=A0A5J4FZG2_9FLAO|nr:hypothetical protein ULMS_05990 [Patiriisocius marinistellae]
MCSSEWFALFFSPTILIQKPLAIINTKKVGAIIIVVFIIIVSLIYGSKRIFYGEVEYDAATK